MFIAHFLKQWRGSLIACCSFLLVSNLAQAQGYIAASTYIGGTAQEENPRLVTVNGESYILGSSTSANYVTTLGSAHAGGASQSDLIVTKLDANGNVLWSRFLGGSDSDFANTITVSNGSVFIGAQTGSPNYPVTNGSTLSGAVGTLNGVYTKLNASTGAIQFSTYLGLGALSEISIVGGFAYLFGYQDMGGAIGNQMHIVKYDISTDNVIYNQNYGGASSDYISSNFWGSSTSKVVGNDIFIVGSSHSTDFPVTNGSTLSGDYDHIYMKVNATTGNITFATYYGGSTSMADYGVFDLRVDNGGVYLLGLTDDTDFPVTDGSTNKGGNDFYLRKYNATTNALAFCKYLGSSDDEYFGGMQVENGVVYLSGELNSSTGYPHTVLPGSYSGSTHMFFTKLNATTGNIDYSTWLHSNAYEYFSSLKVINGNAYILGTTGGSTNNIYPVTNGSKKRGIGEDVVLTKINANNQICFSTFLGSSNDDYPTTLAIENNLVCFVGTTSGNDYPVTNNVTKKTLNDLFWTKLNLAPNLVVSADNTTPATQTLCKNGIAAKIVGTEITFPADSMPLIYRNAVPGTQTPIALKYQWQQAAAAAGPWSNIAGAILQNYTPQVGLVDVYYRRLAYASVCGGNTPISTSSVASVLVNSSTAPTVTVGNVVNTCVGSTVLLGGAPTATANGGATIASYFWTPAGSFSPSNAVANPTITAAATTIYNVLVTDSNGCQQIGQQLVNVYTANAGGNKSACGGQAVRIGSNPIAGLSGVTYAWAASPADPSMTCTTCAQPDVNPAVATTYTLTLTVPITGGGTCTSTSSCVVTPIAAPTTPNFAGPDVVICSGSTATLGLPTEAGFSYTWAPGNYLVTNNTSEVTFQPGSLSMPNPDPITYFLTAVKSGCSFVDQMQAAVIEARAGQDGCGPRSLGEGDRTPNINETYLWTVVSGDGHIIGANNTPQINVSATTAGNTVYQLSVTHNGTTCTDQVIVPTCGCPVPIISVQAPNSCASYVLNSGTVALTATSPLNCTYTWSPSAGLSNTTGQTVYLTDNVHRTYTVTATSVADPTFFCINTREVNHPAWSLPVFSAQDATVCPGTAVNIGQATIAGYSYLWSGNTNLLSANTISNPTATVNSTNAFPILVTDVGSGCTKIDTATITIVGLPANVAGDDVTFCGSGTVQLGKTAEPNVTYIWTPATTYTPNNTAANPSVAVAITTLFTVVATNTVTGCSVTDNVTVTVNPAVAPFSFTNQTFCPSTVGAIALPAGPSGMASYTWSPASLVVSNTSNGPTATTLAARPQSATNYTLTTTNASGCVGAATVTFTPSVSVPATGGNKSMCTGTTLQLGGAPEAGATYVWSSNPVAGNPFFSSTAIANPTFTPTTAGIYTLKVDKTDAGGCITTASVTITVNTYLLPALANPTVCENSCVQIGPSLLIGVQYFWSPATGLSNANINNPTACVTNTSTTYTLTAVAANGCSDSKTVVVGVNPSPAPGISLPAVTACLRDVTATLNPTITPSGTYNYNWLPNNGTLSNIYSASPVVNLTGVGTQTYTVTVTNTTTGCTSKAEGTVLVNNCVAVGSVGNYVWNDTNSNGLNDEAASAGINGVAVELWNNDTNTLVATTTTANDGSSNAGYYNFVVTASGNYYVKFPTNNSGKVLTTQTTTAATDGNSDANTSTGNSPVFAIDVNGTGTAKDNATLDAGYKICAPVCVPITVTKTK